MPDYVTQTNFLNFWNFYKSLKFWKVLLIISWKFQIRTKIFIRSKKAQNFPMFILSLYLILPILLYTLYLKLVISGLVHKFTFQGWSWIWVVLARMFTCLFKGNIFSESMYKKVVYTDQLMKYFTIYGNLLNK